MLKPFRSRLAAYAASAFLIASALSPLTALAAPTGNEAPAQDTCPPGATCLRNPLGTTSIPAIVGRVISAALGVVGAIAFLMFVYGGFLWLTSGGSSEQVKKGQEAMKWASIGLIVIFSSYGLVQLVFRAVTG